jgi:hypothetical protein
MKNILWVSQLLMLLTLAGCESGFLDAVSDKKLLVPKTMDDLQSLLDNHSVMNQSPFMTQISADDFYSTDQGLQARELVERNSYLWADDLYEGTPDLNWNRLYEQVFYANVVLEGIESLAESEKTSQRASQIKGAALFYRAFSLHHLAAGYTLPYVQANAASDPGVPVPLSADVNEKRVRGSVEKTYGQITSDLLSAAELLPEIVSMKSRPSKPAALALLARVYLSMHRYGQALESARQCLAASGQLLDYNTLTADPVSAVRPFPDVFSAASNPEVIFYSPLINVGFLTAVTTIIDSTLFKSYQDGDLRRSLFFVNRGNGVINFKGSYSGRSPVTTFAGLATDEVYLIAAECQARLGDSPAASVLINTLLAKRYKTGRYQVFTSGASEQLLEFILTERRKELVGRAVRWNDLRRLNSEPQWQDTLIRVHDGKRIVLLPNAAKYTFPIPDQEIQLSGFMQNPR